MPEEEQAAVDSENYEERCEEGCNEDHGDESEEEEFEDYEEEGFLTTRRKVLMGLIVILLSALLSYQVFFKKDHPIKSMKIANNLNEAEVKVDLFSDVKSDLPTSNVIEKKSENIKPSVASAKEEPDVLDSKGLEAETESEEHQEEEEEDFDGSEASYDDFDDIGMNEEDYENEDEIDDYEFLQYLDYDQDQDFEKEKNEVKLESESENEVERIIVTEDVLSVPTPIVEVVVPEPAPVEEEEEEDHLELDTVYFLGVNPAFLDIRRNEYCYKDRYVMSVRGDGTDVKYFYAGQKHSYYDGETLSCLHVHKDSRKAVFKSVYKNVPQLFLLDLDTLRKTEVPFSNDNILVNPSFSPDGQKLVVKSHTNAGVNISIIDLSENTIRALLSEARPVKSIIKPQFTPDGKYIVYADSDEVSGSKFYKLNLEEPEAEPELIFESPLFVMEFVISPHGEKIAFTGRTKTYYKFNDQDRISYRYTFFVRSLLAAADDDTSLLEFNSSEFRSMPDVLLAWSSCGKYVYKSDQLVTRFDLPRLQKVNVKTGQVTPVMK